MKKFIPVEKQQKSAQKEFYDSQRSRITFNTGTRVHKTDKKPNRARRKELDKKLMDD